MTVAGFIASLVVGFAFVVAGASKIAAGDRWPTTAREMGAPAITIPIVPWVELAVGASLLAQVVVPIPAMAALVLLVAFTALIIVRLSGDDRPSCACFGAWSAEPIGRIHVIRNAVLMALAVVAMFA